MKRSLFLLSGIAGLAIGQPALASDDVPASSPPAAKPDTQPEKKTCRSPLVTGSRLSRRRACHTAAEWRVIDAEQQAAAQDMKRNSNRAGKSTFQ